MRRISVYSADRQLIYREGMHFILTNLEDIEVIGEGTSSNEALNFIESHSPDVVILNINQSTPSGIEITRRVTQHFPSVAMILIMDIKDEECLFPAMKSGASACITRDIASDDLLNIVCYAGKGDKPIIKDLRRPTLATRVLAEFEALSIVDDEVIDVPGRLTLGEADILRRISAGNPGEEAAASLGLSEEALTVQLTAILSKLVANDRRQELIKTTQRYRQRVPQELWDKSSTGYVTTSEFKEFKKGMEKRLNRLYAKNLAQSQGWLSQVTAAFRRAPLKAKPFFQPDRKVVEVEETSPQEKARPDLARGEKVAAAAVTLLTKHKTRNINHDESRRNLLGLNLKPETRLIDFLKRRGYEVEESAKVTGGSGATHTVDILATRDDRVIKHTIAIGVLTAKPGKAEVDIGDLTNFDVITDDIDIHNKMVIVIPKLSPLAQKVAEAQQIRVLGIDDLIFLSRDSPDLPG